MDQFIGCDAHKRVAHDRQLYREFLARLPPYSMIAVEASGNYNWLVDEMLVDEMECSGHRPKLANPLEAKWCMGLTNKTDKLDARGCVFKSTHFLSRVSALSAMRWRRVWMVSCETSPS